MRRQLFEKQAYEASKLESQLRTQEIDDINNILDRTAQKKSDAINEAKQVSVAISRVSVPQKDSCKLSSLVVKLVEIGCARLINSVRSRGRRYDYRMPKFCLSST